METLTTGQILVVNCGSSSLKIALVDFFGGELIASGLADRLNTKEATMSYRVAGVGGESPLPTAAWDHAGALKAMLDLVGVELGGRLVIRGVGHRVVHGGEYFQSAVRITDDVIRKIEACSKLAPLHNPAHVLGIRTAMECFPGVPQVAVFDTAFHQTLPPHAFLYAIPYEYYKSHAIRRYGMHGTSHHYVGMRAAKRLGRPFEELNLLTAHLGNGCSACAIRHGKSVDTTMGLTPLEGVMMGTRSGDVDPSLHLFLKQNAGLSLEQTTEMLNRRSGLLGVSGISNDLRAIAVAAANGGDRAQLAIDLFAYRLAKGLLGLCASLDALDALVFTGGIGENSAIVREKTVAHLGLLGLRIDPGLNALAGARSSGRISPESENTPSVMVIPTDEESMIAQSTAELL